MTINSFWDRPESQMTEEVEWFGPNNSTEQSKDVRARLIPGARVSCRFVDTSLDKRLGTVVESFNNPNLDRDVTVQMDDNGEMMGFYWNEIGFVNEDLLW